MSDEMLKEAVAALKAGQRLRAKDLLTRLIKVDQSNADYWLWMSAAVDTEKEQIYCLQNALKADPNSVPARRGLVVMGALRPEEANLPPAHELEDLPVRLPSIGPGGGLGGLLTQRRNVERLAIFGLGLLTVVVLLTAFFAVFKLGPFAPRQNFVVVTSTPPPTNAPPTAAVTTLPEGACTLPADPNPATPLAAYLCLTQTATPVPVATVNFAAEDFKTIQSAYTKQQWDRIVDRAASVTTDPTLADSAEVFFYVAEAYRHTGNLPEALKNYRAAIKKNANFAPAYWGQALVEIAQSKLNEARADFDKALSADPAFVPAYLDRAALAGSEGKWDAAVADLEAARLAAPSNALVKAYLALAYVAVDRASDGQAMADAAVARDPGLALGYFARGRVALALGHPAESEADLSLSYKYVLTLDHPLPAQWQASVLYFTAAGKIAIGDDATGLTLLNQAIGLDDQNALAFRARADLYLRAAGFEAARADYSAAITLFERSAPGSPALAWTYVGLGQALMGLTQPEGAAPAFQAALDIAPDGFAANLGLGQAQFQNGKLDDALAALNAALPLAHGAAEQAPVYQWRAEVYRAAGRTAEEAVDLLTLRALIFNSDPRVPTVVARLTEIGPLPTETPGPTATGPTPTATATATRTATP